MQRYLSRRCVTIPMLRAAAAHRAANKGCEVRPRGEAENTEGPASCTALIPSYLSATRCATLARADYIKWLVKRSA